MAPVLKEMLASTPALPFDEVYTKLSGPMEDRPQFMYWMRHADVYPDFHPAKVMKGSLKHCDRTSIGPGQRRFLRKVYGRGRQFPTLSQLSRQSSGGG